jgi:SAM-dependent methyltransferase
MVKVAQRFNVSVVGVEQDPDSITKARTNIEAARLSVGGASAWQNRVSTVEGNIFQLDRITDKFDYVLAEAIVTMQSNPGKAKILSIIRDRLKPAGKFLAHELLVHSAEEMFADIHQGYLWVSAENYDSAVYPNPVYGFIFQGIHDYDHYLTASDFSLIGEIVAYNFTIKRVPSLEIQKILYSEIVLRTAAYLQFGHAAAPKVVFP